MMEKWFLIGNGLVKHESGRIKKLSDIEDQLNESPPRVELLNYENSEFFLQENDEKLKTAKDLLVNEISAYWKEQKEKDLSFNGETFPFYEGIEVNILGKIQLGGLYEAMNGAGSFITTWTKKDYSEAVLNLEQVWLFGMAIAEQIEATKKQEAKHLANLEKLGDYDEIKGYNFRAILN